MSAREMTPERLAEVRASVARWPAGNALVELLAHIDALTARLEASERGAATDARNFYELADQRNAWAARTEVAEAKLAALVEECRPAARALDKLALDEWAAFDAALRAARGEP